jgi:hypothetical protein
MLIRFQGENTGSFVMFEEIAQQLLRMMGTSGKTEGALREEDVPQALSRLEAAVAPYKAASQNADDEQDDGAGESVGLATRAAPLLDLLRLAKEKGGYVMWQPENKRI